MSDWDFRPDHVIAAERGDVLTADMLSTPSYIDAPVVADGGTGIKSLTRGPRCHQHGIQGYGNPEAGVFLIGIAPGSEETRTGLPMTGQSGKLTDSILDACGWSRDKTYATNLLCYQPRNSSHIPFEELMECWPRLRQEAATYRPKLCVLLGTQVTQMFFPDRKPGNVRGAIDWYEPWGCYLLPTYHPAALLYGAGEFTARDLVRDFSKIPYFFSTTFNPTVEFEVVTTYERAQQILDNLPRDRKLSLDLENPMKEEDSTSSVEDETIICFSISVRANAQACAPETTYWFDNIDPARLTWPTDRLWGGQNFMYDSISIHQKTGLWLPYTWDSIYGSYCTDERGGNHGLKGNAREYLGAGFYEDYPGAYGQRDPDGQPVKIKLPKGVRKNTKEGTAFYWNSKLADKGWASSYNTKDAAYAGRLDDYFMPRVEADGMMPVYKELLAAADVYRRMQAHGVYLNPNNFQNLLSSWLPVLEAKAEALTRAVVQLGGPANINLGSNDQIAEFLFGTLRLPCSVRTATGKPSTAAPVIEELEDESDFVASLIDLRHMEKAVNTYLVGTWQHIKLTCRVHPSPLLHAQVSNRVAYNNPAINTTPKGYNENPYLQQMRSLYTAPDNDHVLIEADYKQAEVWMAYQYSQDAQMWADLQSGDFHRKSASFIYGIEPEQVTGEQRSDAKRITFGKFFLIGADKFAKQSNREKRRDALRLGKPFENPMTRFEAAKYSRAWDARYPGYIAYTERMFQDAVNNGELVSLDGRKRRFPIVMDDSIMTQCANWPIQTTAHACLMSSIVEAYYVLLDMGAHILIDVHDAMLIEARKDNAMDVIKRLRDIMCKPRYPGVIPIPAEFKIGYSWLHMEEVELAA